VFDSAALSANQTLVFLYNNGANDFTDEVMAEINKDAPAGSVTPAKPDVKPIPDALNPKKPL
jgi:hypothetical protein